MAVVKADVWKCELCDKEWLPEGCGLRVEPRRCPKCGRVDWNANNSGWVYLAGFSCTTLVKIGFTERPEYALRLREVSQAEMPGKLISPMVLFKSIELRALESALHRHFADKRKDGEWFELTFRDLEWAVTAQLVGMGFDWSCACHQPQEQTSIPWTPRSSIHYRVAAYFPENWPPGSRMH
jgi:hypothetical protein